MRKFLDLKKFMKEPKENANGLDLEVLVSKVLYEALVKIQEDKNKENFSMLLGGLNNKHSYVYNEISVLFKSIKNKEDLKAYLTIGVQYPVAANDLLASCQEVTLSIKGPAAYLLEFLEKSETAKRPIIRKMLAEHFEDIFKAEFIEETIVKWSVVKF